MKSLGTLLNMDCFHHIMTTLWGLHNMGSTHHLVWVVIYVTSRRRLFKYSKVVWHLSKWIEYMVVRISVGRTIVY